MKLDYDELMSEYDGEDLYQAKPRTRKFKDNDRDKIDHQYQKNIRKQRQAKQKRQSQIEQKIEYVQEEEDELY